MTAAAPRLAPHGQRAEQALRLLTLGHLASTAVRARGQALNKMKVSKEQSQPEIVAAAFLSLYMVLGSPF